MKILTLAMQVPDSRAALKIAPGGKSLETHDLKLVCNPFDEFAVEQAVQLKEQRSDVEEIVVATIGAEEPNQAIRTALAMGADRGIQLCDDIFSGQDEILLAEALAAAIRLQETTFDLILCGKQAIDTDSGEFGPALAEFLDLPHVGAVVKLDISEDGTSLRAHRRIEGAEEIVESPLPALITCEKGLIEPRYPSLPNLMKAKKKPLQILAASDLPEPGCLTPGLQLLELTPPAPRPPCTFIEGPPEKMARELVKRLRDEAKVI